MKNDVTLTLECNNNCIFCPRYYLEPVSCGSYKKALRALKKARKDGDQAVLTGGEITILPEFFKIIDYCKKIKFRKIGIITNGRMLSNRDFTLKMLRGGVTDVTISLYSHLPEIHDRITKVNGSCKQTWKGIGNVILIGRNFNLSLKINLLINSYNYQSVYKTIQSLYSLGVRNFLLIDPIETERECLVSYEKIINLHHKLSESRMKGSLFCFRGYPLCLFNGEKMKGNSVDLQAISGKPEITISWENQDIDTHVTLSEDGLQKYLKNFSDFFMKINICKGCALNKECNGVQKAYIKNFTANGFVPIGKEG